MTKKTVKEHPLVKALKASLDEVMRMPKPTLTVIPGVVVEAGGYRMIVTQVIDDPAVIPPV